MMVAVCQMVVRWCMMVYDGPSVSDGCQMVYGGYTGKGCQMVKMVYDGRSVSDAWLSDSCQMV